jgi:hypothetical protein
VRVCESQRLAPPGVRREPRCSLARPYMAERHSPLACCTEEQRGSRPRLLGRSAAPHSRLCCRCMLLLLAWFAINAFDGGGGGD